MILSDVKSLCRVMDIELCIRRLFTLHRKERARKMVEFTIYFESIRPTGTCGRMVNLDTNRSECKSSIVLANMLAKGVRKRAYARKEVLEGWRRRRKRRKVYLTLKTALTEFYIMKSGSL